MPKHSFKKKAREKYSKIGQIKCPAFPKEKILFNAKGFNHLFYKGSHRSRGKKHIQIRVKLLDQAVKLLKIVTIFQEKDRYLTYIKGQKKTIKYWAFEGVIDNRRIKVIIRQIGKGKKHFWSVIPAWRKTRYGKRLNYKRSLRRL